MSTIITNKHGGVKWNLNIQKMEYNDFVTFLKDLKNTKRTYICKDMGGFHNGYMNRVTEKDIENSDVLLSDDGEKYFKLIKQSGGSDFVELRDLNSYQRLIVYLICKFYGLHYSTIKTTEKVLIPCTDFLPCNEGVPRERHHTKDVYTDELVCGCYFAPAWFARNHHGNNYDDTISYSYTYRTRKTGVKINFTGI